MTAINDQNGSGTAAIQGGAVAEIVGPPRERFLTSEWHERDLEVVFRPMWHLVCHATELPDAGSYMTFTFGEEEIFVIRTSSGEVRGYHNFCRHRGHRLCTSEQGSFKRMIVCPYHSWAFSPEDGSCRVAVRMHEGFNHEDWPLFDVAVEEVDGLVFACLSDTPPASIGAAMRDVDLGGFDLARMKLAVRKSYIVQANWKIVVENNSECYHCAVNHPELCTVYDPWATDYVEDLDAVSEGSQAVSTISGADVGARTLEGQTWTVDGEHVCALPLPRTNQAPAHGREFYWQPGNMMSIAPEYAFVFTLRPIAPDRTLKTDFYLVHEDAEEGVDYDLETLTRFWSATMDQDGALCEEVQRGMRMPRFTPGPLNRHYQAGQISFYRWYEERLQQAGVV